MICLFCNGWGNNPSSVGGLKKLCNFCEGKGSIDVESQLRHNVVHSPYYSHGKKPLKENKNTTKVQDFLDRYSVKK